MSHLVTFIYKQGNKNNMAHAKNPNKINTRVELTKQENKIIRLYMVQHDLKSKSEAIKHLIRRSK